MQNYGINLGNEPRDKKSDATHFLCEEETPTIPIIMLIDGFSAIFAVYQLSWEVEKLYFAAY